MKATAYSETGGRTAQPSGPRHPSTSRYLRIYANLPENASNSKDAITLCKRGLEYLIEQGGSQPSSLRPGEVGSKTVIPSSPTSPALTTATAGSPTQAALTSAAEPWREEAAAEQATVPAPLPAPWGDGASLRRLRVRHTALMQYQSSVGSGSPRRGTRAPRCDRTGRSGPPPGSCLVESVLVECHGVRLGRLIERRPPAVRVELRLGAEQLGGAAGAGQE